MDPATFARVRRLRERVLELEDTEADLVRTLAEVAPTRPPVVPSFPSSSSERDRRPSAAAASAAAAAATPLTSLRKLRHRNIEAAKGYLDRLMVAHTSSSSGVGTRPSGPATRVVRICGPVSQLGAVELALRDATSSVSDLLVAACRYFDLDPSSYTIECNAATDDDGDDGDDRNSRDVTSRPLTLLPEAPLPSKCGELQLVPLKRIRPFDPDLVFLEAQRPPQPPPLSGADAKGTQHGDASPLLPTTRSGGLAFDSSAVPKWRARLARAEKIAAPRSLADRRRRVQRRFALLAQSCLAMLLAALCAASVSFYLSSRVHISSSAAVLAEAFAWDETLYPTLSAYFDAHALAFGAHAYNGIIRVRQLRVNPVIIDSNVTKYPSYTASAASTNASALQPGAEYHANGANPYACVTLRRLVDGIDLAVDEYDSQAGGYYSFINVTAPSPQSLPASALIDRATRLVALEFNSYNRDAGIMTSVKILAQYPPWGAPGALFQPVVLVMGSPVWNFGGGAFAAALGLASVGVFVAVTAAMSHLGALRMWTVHDHDVVAAREMGVQHVGLARVAADTLSRVSSLDPDFAGGKWWVALHIATAALLVAAIALHPDDTEIRAPMVLQAMDDPAYVEFYDTAKRARISGILLASSAFLAIVGLAHLLKLMWTGALALAALSRAAYLILPIVLGLCLPVGAALAAVGHVVFGPAMPSVFGDGALQAAYVVVAHRFQFAVSWLVFPSWKPAFAVLVLVFSVVLDALTSAAFFSAYLAERRLRSRVRLAVFSFSELMSCGFCCGAHVGDSDEGATSRQHALNVSDDYDEF